MKGYRLHWDAELGWILDVPVSLTPYQIDRVAKWALPFQIQRYRSLPPGDKKEELVKAIELLKQGKIQQRLIETEKGVYRAL